MRNRILLLGLGALVIMAMPAMAFHDEGVAHCNGCHTMHNSMDGEIVADGGSVGVGLNRNLLLFDNPTDVCLDCHAGNNGRYTVWSADPAAPHPNQIDGGGDFSFLLEDNINEGHGGATNPILGYETGHSLISSIKSTVADPVNEVAPGGTYPREDMHCTSCHDPHGTGSFRLLYQDGQQSVGWFTGNITNWMDTLEAEAGANLETNSDHNAYKGGYSEWCSTCHTNFHAGYPENFIHPSGTVLGLRQRQVYNAYEGTEDCIDNPPALGAPCGSGTFSDAYIHEVPFEVGTMTTDWITGPGPNAKVACVSCHRAHASSAQDAGRWDFNVTGLAEDGHESSSFPIPNPYNEYQRSLCNKCHAQDEFDALVDFTPSP